MTVRLDPPEPPFVFATVGTDHHPFDRFVAWIDSWAAAGGRCVVQTGTSAVPSRVPHAAYVDYGVMTDLMRSAAAVACHGGAATMLEVRRAGRKPIVVARRPDLGEHVDDHQVQFTAHLAARGEIALAHDEAGLHRLLDQAIADPEAFGLAHVEEDVAIVVDRFAGLVHRLMDGRLTDGRRRGGRRGFRRRGFRRRALR